MILTSLSKDYDQFVQNYNMHGMGKTIPELHAMLKLVEKGIPKETPVVLTIRQDQMQKPKLQAQGKGKQRGKGKSKLAYNPKYKIPPPTKKEHPTKDTESVEAIGSFDLILSSGMILKRIEKLQHDGLLESIDDESFDVCVSCISGKMARKPFTHASERADDLLGYALESAACIINMVPTKNVNNTPYEMWHGKVLNLSYLKTVGSKWLFKKKNVMEKMRNHTIPIKLSCSKDIKAIRILIAIAAYYDYEIWQMDVKTLLLYCCCKDPFMDLSKLLGAGTRDLMRRSKIENQLGKTIKALRSDQGGEYLSQEFLDHLRSRGIILQLTPPYTPQHNGISERRNQTLLDMVRSMMSLNTLPMSFWGYALESAARILNMVLTKKVNMTPYEMWHGKVPNLSYLKVWGSRYAEFFKTRLKKQEASGSTVDFDEIQSEDAQPSENTSLHQHEVELDSVEPKTDVIPVLRSARIPQAPKRHGFYIDAEEHELGDHGEPPNY
ncbi:retrovirus-related pol polyprotein from transposon TNT 1-94 [Tanacetum coccineum]